MKRVFVTGSSGFIGTRLLEQLLARDVVVKGIDVRPPRVEAHYDAYSHCDILHGERLAETICAFDPTHLIHLAARTDLDGANVDHAYAVNIAGVANVLKAIGRCNNLTRYLITSSQLVCKVGHVPRTMLEYCPNTNYGKSKVETERITRATDAGDATWCLVRPTTVWGPGMSPHYQRFFRMIAKGLYFHIGGGSLLKSYSYIGNIVHQYLRLLEVSPEKIHRKTLYLADYEPLSLKDWANEIQRRLGSRPIPTLPIGMANIMAGFGDLANRAGWRSFPFNSFRLNNILTEYRFDLSEIQAICGPLPYGMQEGVTELVDWLQQSVLPKAT